MNREDIEKRLKLNQEKLYKLELQLAAEQCEYDEEAEFIALDYAQRYRDTQGSDPYND